MGERTGDGTRDLQLGHRLRLATGGSVLLHAVALAAWAATYDPQVVDPAPTVQRAVKAIALTRAPRTAPVVEPEPEPELEAPDASEPEVVSDLQVPPDDSSVAGPPPPPAPCRRCALTPRAIGVPVEGRSRPGAKSIPWGVPGGVPGGVHGGVPGGVVGGTLGGTLRGTLGATGGVKRGPESTGSRPQGAPAPLAVVMQRALHTPPPDPARIARTRAALFHRRPGVNRTAFCVDARGKTVAVRTTKKFPGDPGIDTLCRDTVKAWRFRPVKVGGRSVRVCSVAVFDFDFK